MAALICMAKKHRYVKRALNVIVFNYRINRIELYRGISHFINRSRVQGEYA